jgi:hypothetical protein
MTTCQSIPIPGNGSRFTVQNGNRFLETHYFGTSSWLVILLMESIVVHTVMYRPAKFGPVIVATAIDKPDALH